MRSNGAVFAGRGPDVVVFGQVARDLVLLVDVMPGPGQPAGVCQRRELLGGKGANQAVALAQLGMRPALASAVGEDDIGQRLLIQARRDRVDVSAVVRRPATRTALIVDIVDSAGQWRYLEDIPDETLLAEADVVSARHLLLPGRWVSVQLQQPPGAALAAVTEAYHAGCHVVLDGAPAEADHAGLLAMARVLRADAREAARLADSAVSTVADAGKLAADLLRQGPSLVALAVGDLGNLIAWPDDSMFLPRPDAQVVDAAGAGEAFLAGLIAALAQGGDPRRAARVAVAAAAATASYLGGRPNLTPRLLED